MNEPQDPPQQPPADNPPPPPAGGGDTPFTPPPPGGGSGGGPTGGGAPGGGGPGGGAVAPGNPWDQRARLGFVNALIENTKLFALNPSEAWARTQRTGDLVGPLIFGVLLGWIGAFFQLIWQLLFGNAALRMLMSSMPPEARSQMGPMISAGAGGFVGFIVYPIIAVIVLFIGAAILHLCCMLVGALAESDSGFEGSFRAVAFSAVGSLGYVVPVVGGLIVMVWTIFLAVLGVSTLHRTSQGKALLAVLLPIILCCICCIAFIFFGVGAGVMGGLANQ